MPWKGWLVVSLLGGMAAGHALSSGARRDDEVLRLLERQGAELEALRARLERRVEPASCPPGAVAAVDLSPVQAELQRLREGLAALGPRAAPASEEEARVAEPPGAESLVAVDSSQRLLEQALSSRRWGEAEAQSFRKLLSQMTPKQREEAIQRLFLAINERQLSVEIVGPPF